MIGLNGKRPVDDDAATKAPGEASSGGNGEALASEREREEEEGETGAEAHRQRERGKATEPVRLSGLSRTQLR